MRISQHDQQITADESVEEKARTILHRRALELAKETSDENDEATVEIIEFMLSHERYGVEARHVREVYPLREWTPLPGTPVFIAGIINVRGQIVSVTDLRKVFSLPEKGITDLNKVIIIRNNHMEFGILADAVLGAARIRFDELEPPPLTFVGQQRQYLLGISAGPTMIIDGDRLLSDERLVVSEEMDPAKGGGQ